MVNLNRKEKVYLARIMPTLNIYEVLELIIRTVREDWFVGVDPKSKQAHLFTETDIGKIIFVDRETALAVVKDAEAHKIIKERNDIDEIEDYVIAHQG